MVVGGVSGKRRKVEKCLCRWKSPADNMYICGEWRRGQKKKNWVAHSLSSAHPLGGKFTSYKEFPSCAGVERTPKALKVFSLIHKLLLVVSVSFSLTTRDRRD